MSTRTWKMLAIGFALLLVLQHWRHGNRRSQALASGNRGSESQSTGDGDMRSDESGRSFRQNSDSQPCLDDQGGDEDGSWNQPSLRDHWAVAFLTPQPGETLLDYRDRVVPVAQAAVAPFRAKVKRDLSDFSEEARLSSRQQEEIAAAVERRSAAIQDRIMQAALSGEFFQSRLKVTSGLSFARDVFTEIDGVHGDVMGLLDEEQILLMRDSPFDVIEYLVFSSRWEDMLGVLDSP